MPDLFDPLRDLTREPVTSLPPSEVRRRGDRLRRRRTAVTALGAACAVAVVAIGAVAVAGRSPSTSPEIPPANQTPAPTPSPSDAATPAGPVTRVPEDFPLQDGMLDLDQVEGPSRKVTWIRDITFCGDVASYSPADVQTDTLGVNHDAVENGGFQHRVLMVYPDAATAHRMARDVVDKFTACPARYPVDTGDAGNGERTNDVTSRALGDEAWMVKIGSYFNGEPSFGQEVVAVVRVGNAVAYQQFLNEGPGLTDPAFFENLARAGFDGLRTPVEAMCVFSEEGC